MKKIIIILTLIFSLASCQQKQTYDYLTQHPILLKQEVDRCQAISEKTEEDDQCETVMRAANKVMSVMREEEADPEKFGLTVMATQTACFVNHDQQKCDELKVLNAILALNTPE